MSSRLKLTDRWGWSGEACGFAAFSPTDSCWEGIGTGMPDLPTAPENLEIQIYAKRPHCKKLTALSNF